MRCHAAVFPEGGDTTSVPSGLVFGSPCSKPRGLVPGRPPPFLPASRGGRHLAEARCPTCLLRAVWAGDGGGPLAVPPGARRKMGSPSIHLPSVPPLQPTPSFLASWLPGFLAPLKPRSPEDLKTGGLTRTGPSRPLGQSLALAPGQVPPRPPSRRPPPRGRTGPSRRGVSRGEAMPPPPATPSSPQPLTQRRLLPRLPRVLSRVQESRNLGEEGLPSADRNNKATLLLTGPFRATKSYAKDSSPRASKLQSANHRRALRARRDVRLLRH